MSRGPLGGAPQPGDPASSGPRPPAGWRDVAWLVLTVTLGVVTAGQLIRLAATLVADPDVQVTGGGAFLGFLVTVVWLLTIWWLVAGAWRRSVWGCPFDHTADASWERRCPRHAMVTTDAAAGTRAADEPADPDLDGPDDPERDAPR